MAADFAAGLDDNDPNARIVSIQRLANLNSRATLPLLHSCIEGSTGKEYEWAVYAALRVGDRKVLPKVEELLQRFPSRTLPEDLMPQEIMSITDPLAVSDLVSILLGDSKGHFAAIVALGKIGDPKAVPAIAPHLSDPDEYVRYQALEAMSKLTQSPACKISPDPEKETFDEEEDRCLASWQESGSISP
jgi:HEAT repeat protein